MIDVIELQFAEKNLRQLLGDDWSIIKQYANDLCGVVRKEYPEMEIQVSFWRYHDEDLFLLNQRELFYEDEEMYNNLYIIINKFNEDISK